MKSLKVTCSGSSDIGIVREENQDSLVIHEPSDPEVRRRRGILVALADGMGGLEGGRTASRLAVETVQRSYYESSEDPRTSLERAVRDANRAIFRHARETQGGRQMGSTLTALVIQADGATIGQVGDSRAYCFRKGTISQVTRDHSLVRELVDRGELEESAAQHNVHRNILTRGLGLREDVLPDMYSLHDLQVGDTFLLSSDGMHGLVHEDEMAACLEKFGAKLHDACQELVRVARERGGPDNITVALVHIEAEEDATVATGNSGNATANVGVRPDRRLWLLPLLVFVSFSLGVFLTLIVEEPRAAGDRRVDEARDELQALLDGIPADGLRALGPGARERIEKALSRLTEVTLEVSEGAPR